MAAPSVSLHYNSGTKVFTATVTTDPGWAVFYCTLTSPSGAPYSMTRSSSNPDQWTYQWPPMGPPPSGTWTATAQAQAPPESASGTTIV